MVATIFSSLLSLGWDLSHAGAAGLKVVAATLVSLHVAPHAEGLAAAGVRALEWLLSSVRVAVDPERAGARKGLVARLADVAILRLRERSRRGRRDVVVVLPWVGSRSGRQRNRDGHRGEGLLRVSTHFAGIERCLNYLRQGSLVVESRYLRLRRSGLVVGQRWLVAHIRWSCVWLVRVCGSLDRHSRNSGSGHLVALDFCLQGWRRLVVVVWC